MIRPLSALRFRARRLPALLALLGAVFALASCQPKNASVAPDGRKVVRLFILFLSQTQVDYYAWAEKTFEERNPGIDVVVEQFPGTSLKDFEIKLRLRFASRQEPDLMMASENVIAPLAGLGLLDEAPTYLVQRVETNSLNDMIRGSCYTDGRCYGVPIDAVWQAMYYNKAQFREVGLDPERPPKTWDELLAAAERLTVRGPDGIPTRAGFSLRKTGFKAGTAEKWFTFLFSAGGQPFSADGTAATLDTPEARAALGFYRAVLNRKIDDVRLSGDQAGFGQGSVSMFFREIQVNRWMKETHPEIDFGVAPLPSGQGDSTSMSSGGVYLMSVAKNSPNHAEAWHFIDFLTDDEAYARYVAIGGTLPVMRSVAESPAVQADSVMRVFLAQPAQSAGHFPMIQRAADAIGAYLERFVYGRMTEQDLLTRMQRDVSAILETNK